MSASLYKLPGKAAARAKSTKTFQLRVELRGVKPAVWRRIVVPTTIKLSRLHGVLLTAMGWQGGHLHEFLFADGCYGPAEDAGLDAGLEDESRVSLRKALEGCATFTWVYDYGDNWQHKIKVEREVDLGIPLESPMCITGQGACPPEDVGGVPGYEEFLQAMADPSHPEHDELKAWHGGPFEPNTFDVQAVQQRLDEIKL
ncbi:MAG: plasmid pRiA4b ORF-3 family protein [Polaromonas sp.]